MGVEGEDEMEERSRIDDADGERERAFASSVREGLGEVGREEDGREMVETGHVVMRMQVDSSKRQGQVDGDGDSGAACRSFGGVAPGRGKHKRERASALVAWYVARYWDF